MSRFIGLGRSFFRKYPFIANSAIYGSLYVGAEFSQQYLTKRVFKTTDISTTTDNNNNNNNNVNIISQETSNNKIIVKEHKKEDIDYVNIGRYGIIGTMAYAPSLYIWYKWLDRVFPGTARATIVKKLILDQFLLTPYLLVVFYVGMSLMEGAEDPLYELQEKFMPTFLRSCMFWLPAQTVNFMLIAPRFRVVYMGICGFVWVNILCWIKRQRLPENKIAN